MASLIALPSGQRRSRSLPCRERSDTFVGREGEFGLPLPLLSRPKTRLDFQPSRVRLLQLAVVWWLRRTRGDARYGLSSIHWIGLSEYRLTPDCQGSSSRGPPGDRPWSIVAPYMPSGRLLLWAF